MWWVTFGRVVVKDRGGLSRQRFGEDGLLAAVREQRRAEGCVGLQVTLLLQQTAHERSFERIWFWRVLGVVLLPPTTSAECPAQNRHEENAFTEHQQQENVGAHILW